mmetsp:Transcript_43737/g.49607  ORF Transcript_43737/g.49607 Transcript_43737/m.49607 type:complete len:159 (+) Transcript_43737:98-574(+)
MESFQQKQEFVADTFFQPIHSDVSYDGYEEEQTFAQECFNKSIFRHADESEGSSSPPTVSRANPVGMDYDNDNNDDLYHIEYDNQVHRAITPYPYSPSQEEIEDRLHLASELPRLASLSSASLSSEESFESIDYSQYFGKPSLEITSNNTANYNISLI